MKEYEVVATIFKYRPLIIQPQEPYRGTAAKCRDYLYKQINEVNLEPGDKISVNIQRIK